MNLLQYLFKKKDKDPEIPKIKKLPKREEEYVPPAPGTMYGYSGSMSSMMYSAGVKHWKEVYGN